MQTNTTESLKEIYKGELSASETYKQALEKIKDQPESDQLLTMQKDHFHAMQSLKNYIDVSNEKTPEGSGAWGTWAKTVMGTAKIFGDKSALKALKEGEEHGLKQYEDALNDDIDPSLKNMIKEKFIPRQKSHIRTIDKMMERVAS